VVSIDAAHRKRFPFHKKTSRKKPVTQELAENNQNRNSASASGMSAELRCGAAESLRNDGNHA